MWLELNRKGGVENLAIVDEQWHGSFWLYKGLGTRPWEVERLNMWVPCMNGKTDVNDEDDERCSMYFMPQNATMAVISLIKIVKH